MCIRAGVLNFSNKVNTDGLGIFLANSWHPFIGDF